MISNEKVPRREVGHDQGKRSVSVFGGQGIDMKYYCEKHMPMVKQRLGSACKSIAVEQGIAGGAPGTPPTYVAMGHIYCESVQAFQAAFGPHTAQIMADIPNYTPIQPIIQISEVKM